MVIWIEPIGGKLFNVSFGQSSEFGLSQTLSKVQEGLWEKSWATAEQPETASSTQSKTNLIVFHLSIVDVQL